ncbi:glycosyltransferase family 4 protein [Mucilaginibacter ginsenosidivorans]|uniref:Glycosyltransferase n=1 Tax=Mucilaginibacter ginsenosidivorans TaxID=398053 RepID=A0A5B8V1H2_9SPHI|nr:glycosyltransferase family 4 protein [Mucilaginibacter ginsenosidivorans]QEC64895.1 glycosyltransferase [Mucilaginibacter ginsenosidivorans]
MKLTYISTYPPRECGLASFNKSLINAINSNFHSEEEAFVVAVNNGNKDEYDYPGEVKFIIRQHDMMDYTEAAKFINASDTHACVLQHEFGIYGGDNGVYVLSLVNQLEKPLISVFHTVLEKPSFQQKAILQKVAKRSDKIVVMGKIAVKLLHKIYGIPQEKICFLEHGAPDLESPVNNPVKEDVLFRGRKVLLTFGLLSRNKGLETVIRALPKIVRSNPEVLYVILGSTHPEILKNSGEEYRESLVQLAARLNVSNNVAFINRFVSEDDLINYLTAADIYISPYLNEAQITSGTLAYAVGAGAAVVSTPYWHARELLDEGRGRLFNFKDESGLADIVNDLIRSPRKLSAIKKNAYNYGLNLRWPVIGRKYIDLIKEVIEKPDLSERILRSVIDPEIMPDFSLDYVKSLTNSTGIIQHAKYGIPNWKEGYCVDDNSRAMIMALMAEKQGHKDALDLLPAYMSFMLYMQNEGGYFRNFLSYKNEFLDKIGSEDAFGRAIWALGYLIHHAPSSAYAKFGEELFHKARPNFRNLTHLRGVGNTIIGLSYYLRSYPSDNDAHSTLDHLTGILMTAYDNCRGETWKWFENHLTYDNAILPLALLHSAEITRDEKVLDIAFESMNFLGGITINSKYCNPVGNNGWYSRDGELPSYDQQAIDIMAMVLMYAQAHHMTADPRYLKKLFRVYSWFLGENSLSVPLYDPETKGCYDGLHPTGINLNQGAESTLAYMISHLAVLEAFKVDTSYLYDKDAVESVLLK